MLLHIVILAIIQGLAELLPISSSAHVIVAEKLMGLDPSTPEMTLLLVMLHTGTMFAVIFYFWNSWKQTFFSSAAVFKRQAIRLVLATALIGRDRGPAAGGDTANCRAAGIREPRCGRASQQGGGGVAVQEPGVDRWRRWVRRGC